MAQPKGPGPRIEWKDGTWSVTLPVDNGQQILEATWTPGATYVVRIRQAGHEGWSFGFETPLESFTFVDLKPDTEYEVQVRPRTAAGEGAPTLLTMRTNPKGGPDNIVPFPRPERP